MVPVFVGLQSFPVIIILLTRFAETLANALFGGSKHKSSHVARSRATSSDMVPMLNATSGDALSRPPS